jgi:hypothetical protein
MPLKKLVIPSFKSESEEAIWWENHRAAVEADLRATMCENKTLSLQDVMVQAKQKKALLPVTIRRPTKILPPPGSLRTTKASVRGLPARLSYANGLRFSA